MILFLASEPEWVQTIQRVNSASKRAGSNPPLFFTNVISFGKFDVVITDPPFSGLVN